MKSLVPKSFNRLPPSEKQKIADLFEEQLEKNMLVVLDSLLKMTCSVLHAGFGWGESRLMCYLGNFYAVFQKHSKLVKQGCQIEVLDREMRSIFRKSGYPDEFFRSMFGENWCINTGTNKNIEKTTGIRTFLNEISRYDSLIKNERKTIEYITKNDLPDKDRLIEECEERIFSMKQTKTDVMEAISNVSDPVARAVYTARYVRGEKWRTIAQSLSGMSERNARNIHDQWMLEFEENLEKVRKAA